MNWEEYRRTQSGTGRTTRMLQAAIDARAAGDVVFVLGGGDGGCAELSNRATAMAGLAASGIKFLSYHQYGWMLSAPPVVGAKVFVDHAAIECAIPDELEMLHRFDTDQTGQST